LTLTPPALCGPVHTALPPTSTFSDVLSAGDAGMYGAEAHMMGPAFQVWGAA